jgi:hypothetical protein
MTYKAMHRALIDSSLRGDIFELKTSGSLIEQFKNSQDFPNDTDGGRFPLLGWHGEFG